MSKADLYSLKTEMARIKRQRTPIYTNYYMNTPENAEYDAVLLPGALVFSFTDNGIVRVYFYTNDADGITDALCDFPSHSVIEYITNSSASFEATLSKTGYKLYAVMQKMVNADLHATFEKNMSQSIFETFRDNRGAFAAEDDACAILDLLYKHLDKYTGHFCGYDELIGMLANKLVVCNKLDGEIVSFFMYKLEGRKFYAYQMYSRDSGEGIHCIYYNAIKSQMNNGINYAYNWVNVTNKRVIRFHKWYGFELNPLKDYVYIKE